MHPKYTAEAEAYREKVQAFLAEKLPTNWGGMGQLDGQELTDFVKEWRGTLFSAGYLAPGWPVAASQARAVPSSEAVASWVPVRLPSGSGRSKWPRRTDFAAWFATPEYRRYLGR